MIDIVMNKFNEKKRKVNEIIANNNLTEEEKNSLIEKINLISQLLNNDSNFSNINMNAALSILEFLEIPENEILNIYCNLIDPKNMKNDDTFFLIDRRK